MLLGVHHGTVTTDPSKSKSKTIISTMLIIMQYPTIQAYNVDQTLQL